MASGLRESSGVARPDHNPHVSRGGRRTRSDAGTGASVFVPAWWPDLAGVVLDASTDWAEITELATESYRLLAPQKLRDRLL